MPEQTASTLEPETAYDPIVGSQGMKAPVGTDPQLGMTWIQTPCEFESVDEFCPASGPLLGAHPMAPMREKDSVRADLKVSHWPDTVAVRAAGAGWES
jgi:hypothetical protein